MPIGTDPEKPLLSAEDAYDVAGYIKSLPRPGHPGRDKDFPDSEFRPADYPVPEYFGEDKKALERAK